jgi:hypothetical protein
MFHLNNKNGLDPAYPPVALNVHVPSYKRRASRYVAFWLKPVSIFGLYTRDDVYQQFTYVGHTVQPSAPSALMLTDADVPYGSVLAFQPSYIVMAASHTPVTRYACATRLLLAEQQVSSLGNYPS